MSCDGACGPYSAPRYARKPPRRGSGQRRARALAVGRRCQNFATKGIINQTKADGARLNRSGLWILNSSFGQPRMALRVDLAHAWLSRRTNGAPTVTGSLSPPWRRGGPLLLTRAGSLGRYKSVSTSRCGTHLTGRMGARPPRSRWTERDHCSTLPTGRGVDGPCARAWGISRSVPKAAAFKNMSRN